MGNYISEYESFYHTFLAEMPWRVTGSNDFQAQLEMLQENLKYNGQVTEISTSIFKSVNDNQVTYWVGNEDASAVSLIVDTAINGNFCKVTLTSKNPAIPRGNPPFAVNLYLTIKKDVSPLHLVFSSDNLLSDDGIKLWSGLLSRSNSISVYDTDANQYVLDKIDDFDTMSKYIGGADKQKYIFVLSESATHRQGVTHMVKIMELKRKTVYPNFLFEQYQQKEQK